MVIPAHVEKLDETHVALGEAAGEQAVRGVAAGALDVGAVRVEHALRFLRKVGEIGHAGLHAKGHFVLRDAGLDFRIAERVVPALVERGEFVERLAAHRAVHAGRVAEVKHGVAGVAKFHALMFRRQKARAPEPVVEWLVVLAPAAKGREHDIRGQVGIAAAEAVGHPRADARPARELRAGLHESDRGIVIDRLGVERADDRPLVGEARHVRHQLAEPRAALAILIELEHARRDREFRLPAGHGRQPLSFADARRQVFAAPRRELRLRVEKVHLRRRAALEKIDDALRLGREIREPRQPRSRRRICASPEQATERGHPDAAGRALEKSAPCQVLLRVSREREEGVVVAVHAPETPLADEG